MTSTIKGKVFHPFKSMRGHTLTSQTSPLTPPQNPSNASSGIPAIANPRGQMRDHHREAVVPTNMLSHFGDIIVDFDRVEAHKAGVIVELTAHEFKVLKYFIERSGLVISREQLLIDVLGYNAYPTTRTVDNHVYKLRQKLEPEPDHPIYFRTVRGIGYRFVGDAVSLAPRSINNSYNPKSHPGDTNVSQTTDVQIALLRSLSLLYHLMTHNPRTPPPADDVFDHPVPSDSLAWPAN